MCFLIFSYMLPWETCMLNLTKSHAGPILTHITTHGGYYQYSYVHYFTIESNINDIFNITINLP